MKARWLTCMTMFVMGRYTGLRTEMGRICECEYMNMANAVVETAD